MKKNQNNINVRKIRESLIKTSLKGAGKLKKRAALPKQKEHFKRSFVATYRGVNYFPDRWDYNRKREHYTREETGKTQYAEAVLMENGSIYTVENSKKNLASLQETSQKIQSIFTKWAKTGPCLAYTVKPSREPYLFNSLSDYLQHCYSNGISQHLIRIADLSKTQNFWLQEKLPNAYNYALSTGERPYHGLRYALSLKEYYAHSFEPCYNSDGSIDNVHAGKLDIFLFKKEEFINYPNMNRVTQMILQGRTPIDHNIASEVETAFIGEIPGQHLVAQLPLRFPSFHKPYKSIYEVKYGLNEELYNLFHHFIIQTKIFSEERKMVIELLKEWLCAYYEVLAIFIAQELAESQSRKLTYLDSENNEQDTPPLRPFTRGHHDTQNQTHILQNIRYHLADAINDGVNLNKGEIFFPSVDLPKQVKSIQENDQMLKKLVSDKSADTETIKLTSSQEAEAIEAGETTYLNIKVRKAKEILSNHSQTFFSQRLEMTFSESDRLISPKVIKLNEISDDYLLPIASARKRLAYEL